MMAYSDFDGLPSTEVDFVARESRILLRGEKTSSVIKSSAIEGVGKPNLATECSKKNVPGEKIRKETKECSPKTAPVAPTTQSEATPSKGVRADAVLTGIESRPNSDDILPPSAPIEIIGAPDPVPEDPVENVVSEQVKKSAKKDVSIIKLCAMVSFGLIGLWLYVQLASLLRFALSCSGWRLYVALMLFAIPVAAIVWVMVIVFVKVLRKPKFEQENCSEKDGSRLLRQKLCDGYLRKIKMPDYIEECDYTEAQGVQRIYDRLTDKYKIVSDQAWLEEFMTFQRKQEEQARASVMTYCKLIGLKTAMCPWKIIDVVCVLVNTTLMVSRIAMIFNRRLSSVSASRLVIRWCMNLYISGELGDVVEKSASGVGRAASEMAKEQNWFGKGTVGDYVGDSLPVLSKWLGKIAEGATNAYLAYRLGNRAIDEFKALKVKESH